MHGLRAGRGRSARWWIRALPEALLVALGAAAFAQPLGMARHFHPDTGWAVTVGAWIALSWLWSESFSPS